MALLQSLAAALVAAACGPALAQPLQAPPNKDSAIQTAPTVRISAERLAAIRQAMTAQVAVYDAGENAMRQPTAAEAAALQAGASTQAAQRIVALPGGGLALRQDMSNLNYLVVDLSKDGKAALRHGSAQSVGSGNPAAKGDKHAQ